MRRLMLCGALALAGMAVTPAYAWYDYQHNTDDSLIWRSEGQAIELHSDNRYGIEVTDVNPVALRNLRKGDVILAVDGHPVKHVAELLHLLYASKPAAVKVRLRRGGSEQALTIPAADYTHIVSPQPPQPPAPPTTPRG